MTHYSTSMNARSTFKLINGVEIPVIGFGTWQTPDGEVAVSAVKQAITDGYRHIDCAAVYGNEKSVGQGIAEGIKAAGITREQLFVTSKVWNTERGYEKTKAAFYKTLADLRLSYLDLYLVHWPANSKQYTNAEELNRETWKAMIELYLEGRIRSIGISNFLPHHLEQLFDMEVQPMVNQIEYHPGFLQKENVAFCRQHQILVEAWSPLGSGRVLQDKDLQRIADKYQTSTAKVCIRMALQNGVLPLPKSITAKRITDNLQVFGFELSKEDIELIANMPESYGSGLDPDQIDF